MLSREQGANTYKTHICCHFLKQSKKHKTHKMVTFGGKKKGERTGIVARYHMCATL